MTLRAVIRTARLTLRPFEASDEDRVIAGIGNRDVARWLSAVPHPYGPEHFRSFLPTAQPGKVWAIEDSSGLVGAVGLGRELGYWLAADRHGLGYATEAARAVLAAHFADPAAGLVRTSHFSGNAASARVLANLGFRGDGFRSVRPVSRPEDEVLAHTVSLTRSDWLNANPLIVDADRLVLKPLNADRDWRDLSRIGGDPRVAPMLLWVLSPWPEAEVRRWVNRSLWRGHTGFRLGIFLKDGPLVGVVGLFPDPVNVMYFIDPDHWGRGYVTEAMQAFLDWAVPYFALTEIEADHFADNPASGCVLEKLGFTRIGTGMGTSRARPDPAPNVIWRLTLPSSTE